MARMTSQIYYDAQLNRHMTRLWYEGDKGEQRMKVVPTHRSQIRPPRVKMLAPLEACPVQSAQGTVTHFSRPLEEI
jgi:hypothetical protein